MKRKLEDRNRRDRERRAKARQDEARSSSPTLTIDYEAVAEFARIREAEAAARLLAAITTFDSAVVAALARRMESERTCFNYPTIRGVSPKERKYSFCV